MPDESKYNPEIPVEEQGPAGDGTTSGSAPSVTVTEELILEFGAYTLDAARPPESFENDVYTANSASGAETKRVLHRKSDKALGMYIAEIEYLVDGAGAEVPIRLPTQRLKHLRIRLTKP